MKFILEIPDALLDEGEFEGLGAMEACDQIREALVDNYGWEPRSIKLREA